jgi:plasmid stabilization system protein ParE
MTGWSVVVARTAERDLTEAVLYIKDRLGNQAAALRLLDEFESIVADIAAKRGTDN